MASFLPKKEVNKRDLNFFEEYAVASRRLANIYRISVLAAIAVIAVIVVYAVILAVNLGVKKSTVAEYNVKFETEQYKNMVSEANELSSQLERRNSYYYSLTAMRRDVESAQSMDPSILRLIQASIPNDAVLHNIDLTGSYLSLLGNARTYYTPAAMYNLINESEVFANNPNIQIIREDPENLIPEYNANTFLNADYEFTIDAALVGQSVVSISAITDTGISIGNIYIDNIAAHANPGITVIEVENGGIISIGNADNSISTVQFDGVNYSLTSVLVNGTALSTADIDSIYASGRLSRYVNEDVDIVLNYTVVAETPADGEVA